MISDWLSRVLAQRGIHYGWAMVAVTFLTALITAASVGAPGIFIVPMQMEFGWNTVKRWLFSSVNRPLRPLPCSAPADERHVLSPPQSNLAAPKIAGGRHAHVTPSHPYLSRMLLENDRLALV